MTIKLTILFLLCSAVKETLNPQAFFWAALIQKFLLFSATIPVLLWLSDSIRAQRLRAEIFNALPLLERVAGVTIPLWSLWWWFDARGKTGSYKFLRPYVPDEKYIFLLAALIIVALYLTAKVTEFRQRRRETPPEAPPPPPPLDAPREVKVEVKEVLLDIKRPTLYH